MESWHTIRLPVEARLHWKQEPLSRNNQTRYSLYSVAPVKRRPRLRRCGVGTRHYRAAHAQQQQLTAAATAVAAHAGGSATGLLSLSASAAAPNCCGGSRAKLAAPLQGWPHLLPPWQIPNMYGRKSPADMQRSYLG